MKKLLTIICALSLILAFSMPAAAADEFEDNAVNAAFLADNQANLDDSNGNMMDSTEVEVGDVEDNFQNNSNQDNELLSDNEDNTVAVGICAPAAADDSSVAGGDGGAVAGEDNDVNMYNDQSDTDSSINTDNEKEDVVESNNGQIAAKGGEIEDDHSTDIDTDIDNDWDQDNSVDNEKEDVSQNNGDAAWKGGEIDKSVDNEKANSDNREEYVEKNGSDNREYDDSFNYEDDSATATLSDNRAAAAFGGTAIALDIENIQLNLAETSSFNGIYQDSGDFDADADAEAETDDKNGGAAAGAAAGIMMNCTSLDTATSYNVGNTLVNANAGNFNNQAGINSVTATIQY